jgi:glycosyltransferase involved in cell wall biosynthesis
VTELACVVLCLAAQPELVDAVRSVKDQVDELVVVNTGGGDARATLSRAGLGDVTVVHREERHFPGGARNLGIEHTSAPYVSFLAADNIAHPGWGDGRRRRHRAGAKAVASCMVALPDDPSSALAAHMLMFHTRSPTTPPQRRKLYGVSYAREVFDTVGLFDPSLRTAEDTDLQRRLDVPIEWAPDVRNSHRNPPTLRALIADRYERGRRVAEAAHLLPGSPRRRDIAASAVRNIRLSVYWSWHGAPRAERLRQIRAWPLLPLAALAYSVGVVRR